MPLISEQDATHLRSEFETNLVNPVKLVMFTQTVECQFCTETRQIVEEVAGLSDKISPEIHNFVTDKPMAELLGVDKIPAIAVLRVVDGEDKDYGVRFYGIPSGYEFMSFVDSIKTVSVGQAELMPETLAFLDSLDEPLHIQVFVTPT